MTSTTGKAPARARPSARQRARAQPNPLTPRLPAPRRQPAVQHVGETLVEVIEARVLAGLDGDGDLQVAEVDVGQVAGGIADLGDELDEEGATAWRSTRRLFGGRPVCQAFQRLDQPLRGLQRSSGLRLHHVPCFPVVPDEPQVEEPAQVATELHVEPASLDEMEVVNLRSPRVRRCGRAGGSRPRSPRRRPAGRR